MPTPKDGEKETDFMERCVPMMQDEGMPNKQAVATCMNMFREKKGFFALKVKTTTVFIKSRDADKAVVAGWGVIFDGKDLEGETFTGDTDFMLDLVKEKATLYDHGANQGVKASIIGRANVEPDEFGLWVEAELDLHQKYVDQVLKLVEKSALGWSSGALGHLVQKDGHKIKRWPIVEFSLTPTPAEPRTLGVERLKSLAENYPDLNALIPEAAASGDEGARNRLKLQALAYTQYGE